MGETFVAIRAISGDLEKDIAAHVRRAATKAEQSVKIAPKVDTGKATSEFKKLENAVSNVTPKLDQNTRSTGILGRAMDFLRGKMGKVGEEGGAITRNLHQVTSEVLGLTGGLQTVGVVIGAVIGAVAYGIDQFLGLAESVHKFQLITGASAEESSRFVVAFRLLGVDADRVAAGLFRFGRQLEDGTSKLGAMGITIARTKAGNVDLTETFLNVADAVASATTGGERAQIAYAAFGRQGLALLPILARGREGLADLFAQAAKNNEILHEADIIRAIELKIQLTETKEALKGLGVEVGKNALPLVSVAAKVVRYDLQGVNAVVQVGVDAWHSLTGATRDNATADREAAASATLAGQHLDTLRSAVIGAADARLSLSSSATSERAAALSLSEAEAELSRLHRVGAVDAKAVASARDSVSEATYGASQAQKRLNDALAEFQKVQEGPSGDELARANIRVEQAQIAAQRSTQNLTELQKHHRTKLLDLQEAQVNVEQTQLDLTDAQTNLNDVQSKGSAESDAYKAAQEKVEQAQHDVTTAAKRQKDAEADLRTARAGDPAFADNLAQAELRVSQARDAVASASQNHLKQAEAYTTAVENEGLAFGVDSTVIDGLRAELVNLANEYHINIQPILDDLDSRRTKASTNITREVFLPPGTPDWALPSPGGKSKTLPKSAIPDWAKGGKAAGGPTEAGYWYQVNERGEEWFRSNSSGTVLPIGQAPTGGSGLVINNNQVIHGSDPAQTAQEVSVQTGRALRTYAR